MPLPSAIADHEWAKRLHRMDEGVPYGIALALAALVIYPDTPWMTRGM
jgi:prepilin peptidase CpaA